MPTTDTEFSRLKHWWPRVAIALGLLWVALFLVKLGSGLWLDHQRGQLEQEFTRATGYTTRIQGPVTATLFPSPGFALADVTLSRDGKPVVTAKEFQSSFELLPLLAGKFIPHAVHIYGMDLRLRTDAQGAPIFPPIGIPQGGTPAPPPAAGKAVKGMRYELPDTIEVHDSRLAVLAPGGTDLYSVDGFNLAVHSLRNKAALSKGLAGDWKLALYANFRRASLGPVPLGPSQLSARMGPRQTVIDIDRSQIFDGRAHGTLSWVDQGVTQQVSTKLAISQFDAARAITAFQKQSIVGGRLDLQADLSATGGNLRDMLRDATGTVQLSGTNLDLVTVNLDDLVARVIKSQQYNLVDAAAYFFLGPLGASVTKGLNVADVFQELAKGGGTSNRILRMISDWKLKNGIASATDVALETKRYRLALKGDVNLRKNEFNNVRIAVVDDRGCAIASQRLDGPIASPRIEKLNMVISVTQPMLDALSKSAKGLIGGNCDPFYRGALLPQPASTATPADASPQGKPANIATPEGSKADGTPSQSK